MIEFDSNQSPDSSKNVKLVIVLFLACIAAFIGGAFFMTIWQSLQPDDSDRNDGFYAIDDDLGEDISSETNTISADLTYTELPGALEIEWISPDQQPEVDADDIFVQAMCHGPEGENYCGQNGPVKRPTFVRLGTVVGEAYEGYSLDMATVVEEGLGENFLSFYLLRKKDHVSVLLDKHYRTTVSWLPHSLNQIEEVSRATDGLGYRLDLLEGYVIETEAYVPELTEFVSKFTDDTGNTYALTGYWLRLYSDEAISLTSANRSAAMNSGETLWLYEPPIDSEGNVTEGFSSVGRDQFYLIDEDGRLVFYDLEVPFFDYQLDGEGHPLLTQGVPVITWSNGVNNKEVYFKGALGGCGWTTMTHVVDQNTIDSLNLIQVGKTSSGIAVFEPSSYDIAYFENVFNTVTFDDPSVQNKTYDDYDHPIIYVQDAFNRWIEFTSYELIPPVECGKPVIYLYPEEALDVRVEVAPAGGFSYTEPEYNDGWNVIAYTNGYVLNKVDGREYPYLFWEGRGGLYPRTQTYWVIDQSSVESFLRSTLNDMNLSQRETDEFVEFWLPRMQDAPFYKIGFHGTAVMDELAPISLSVKPDEVFRLLMDYEELSEWEISNPPKFVPKVKRQGFYLIEWGGVLR